MNNNVVPLFKPVTELETCILCSRPLGDGAKIYRYNSGESVHACNECAEDPSKFRKELEAKEREKQRAIVLENFEKLEELYLTDQLPIQNRMTVLRFLRKHGRMMKRNGKLV